MTVSLRRALRKPLVILLTKYSAGGTRRWVRTYGVFGRIVTDAQALDAVGKVYVCGVSSVTTTTSAAILRKYSPDGAVRRGAGQRRDPSQVPAAEQRLGRG